MSSPRTWRYVAAGGLVAGALDIAWAMGFWGLRAGTPPARILQSVAAGLLGRASYQGGTATVALGLGLHFFNALVMSAIYFAFATRLAVLRERPLLCGGAYGLAIYVVMNWVVVPLSAASPGSRDPVWVALTVLVHVVLVGMPIALFARRGLGSSAPTTA